MRDYQKELEQRVAFIRKTLAEAGAEGVVYGNSGGKDCTLVGILCRKACDKVLSVMLPCSSSRNFGIDLEDAKAVCEQYGIPSVTVDLTPVRESLLAALPEGVITKAALANVAPRLRMTALYALAQSRNSLVAGTGNRSEGYLGYFTKWGDGAHDFNPISDLTVKEIYEFLAYLGAPERIIRKAPSAGLFEGQTDEGEMGITYAEVDEYLLNGNASPETLKKIQTMHRCSEHKRAAIPVYQEKETHKE